MTEFNDMQPIKDKKELSSGLKQISENEQVYSIALFDILGFSNFVETNGSKIVLDLYNKLLQLVDRQKSSFGKKDSIVGSVVPAPVSDDWKSNLLIADANGYINVCHFSDTFIIYVNFLLGKRPFWLRDSKYEPYPLLLGEIGTKQYSIFYEEHRIYLSFLQTCMDFFCQSIVAGIPLRGCISTGTAIMNPYKSIFVGEPIVEAARGETVRNFLSVSFGKSFNNHHPVYNDYFIPYYDDMKEVKSEYLSPMLLDWARYWRESPNFNKINFNECINKMDKNKSFSGYYKNTIKYFEFSQKHANWSEEINREGVKEIFGYYRKTKEWYDTTER